jgi:hypothetical protein
MPATRMPWGLVKAMVQLALAALEELILDGTLNRHHLETDPLTELETWDDVTVQRLPPALHVAPSAALGKQCSVAGTYYDPTANVRAIIAVAESSSARRDAFTALHELGHHIQRTTAAIADELAELPLDITFAVEDRICEEFAAAILIPTSAATAVLGTGTPTAANIVSLVEKTFASRAAVCIRAHENFTVPGMVVLLDDQDVVQIAPARSLPPLQRGSTQSDADIVKKARRRLAAGDSGFRVTDTDTCFEYRNGIQSAPMFAQAADIGGGYIVIVAVTEGPPWQDGFVLPQIDSGPRASERRCEDPACAELFEAWTPTHHLCGEPQCPACHRCGCSVLKVKERTCHGCNLVQPDRFYADASATRCIDCD